MGAILAPCGILARVEGLCPGSIARSSRRIPLSSHQNRSLHTILGRLARPTVQLTTTHIPRRSASGLVRRTTQGISGDRETNQATSRWSIDGNFADTLISKVSSEITHALRSNIPVVALESTIYTHGFPYPQNVGLALGLEEIVRSNGAVPATIGILKGKARVGLTKEEITVLASSAGDPATMKVSRRDLPYILGKGLTREALNGGTTVSATMILAHRAGIKVFGTGGLGGVHRGGEDSMDISADLTELGRTPIAVVASGCKSFLDIPRTLEFLETQGATVCTFADGRKGQIDFPAFYTRDSGIKSHGVVHNAREAASMIYAQEVIGNFRSGHSGMHSGLLFANPIPVEFSIPKEEIDIAIDQAVKEAAEQGFHGSANTPFILARIKDLTKGNSLPANKALIESNVAMAARIAVELCAFRETAGRLPRVKRDKQNPANAVNQKQHFGGFDKPTEAQSVVDTSAQTSVQKKTRADHSIYVFGSVAVDLSCDYTPLEEAGVDTKSHLPQMHTSNIATIVPSIGGVGHNVALAAHRASGGSSVQLRSFVADDLWVVVDANWRASATKALFRHYNKLSAFIAYEPVSVAKSALIFQPDRSSDAQTLKLQPFPHNGIDLATPNQHELAAMHAAAKQHEFFESQEWWRAIDALGIPSSGARDRFVDITSRKLTDEGIPIQVIQLLPFIPTILTKLGSEGVLLTVLLKPGDPRLTHPDSAPYILSRCANGSEEIGGVYMRLFPAVEVVEDVVSVNGVGDTFLGVLVAGLAKGATLDERLIDVAQRGAVMTLRSREAVSPTLGELSAELDQLARG